MMDQIFENKCKKRSHWISRNENKQNPHFVPKILWGEREYLNRVGC